MNPSKKPVMASTLSLLALGLAGLAFLNRGPANGATPSALSTIQKTGVMRVCYAVWPPAVIKDATTGALSGHDIDALRYIADQVGAKLEFSEQTFGTMATAVQSGKCDIGTSLFVKVARAAAVNFSTPLFYAGNSALVRAGETRFRNIEDMNKPGVTIAVANGESGHIYAKEKLPLATIVPIDVESSDLSRFLLEVVSGRADAGLADANTIAMFAAAHPGTTDLFAAKPFDVNPDAWPVRQGDPDFLQFINNSLAFMQANGTWQELEEKYDAKWLHEVTEYRIR